MEKDKVRVGDFLFYVPGGIIVRVVRKLPRRVVVCLSDGKEKRIEYTSLTDKVQR